MSCPLQLHYIPIYLALLSVRHCIVLVHVLVQQAQHLIVQHKYCYLPSQNPATSTKLAETEVPSI
jgi:hypothetical protein